MKKLKSLLILTQLNTREWLRLKFFHVIVFFALLFIAFSHLLSSLTFSVQQRLVFDFGLAGLEISLVMIASLIGTHSIQREIDRKTLLVLISRPIPRGYLVIGSWLSVLLLSFFFCAGFLLSMVLTIDSQINFKGLYAAALSTFLKGGLVAAFAVACGLIVRPILALGASVIYWILCYSMPDIEFFVSKTENKSLLSAIQMAEHLVPKFHLYNWKSYHFIQSAPQFSEVLWAVGHSLAWICFWLFLAVQFFRRKEIV